MVGPKTSSCTAGGHMRSGREASGFGAELENHRETGGVSGYVTIKFGGLGFRIAVLAGNARGTLQERFWE